MNKEWILQLASDVEENYGIDKRNTIFGDIESVKTDHNSLTLWFDNFINGLDELEGKEFLTMMMAKHCPCRYTEAEEDIKNLYKETKTLDEFTACLEKNGIFQDKIELRGNILYATKLYWFECCKILGLNGHGHNECYAEMCHCFLASHTSKPISNIFCHCCTVGYYGKMFKNALGIDVKVEFVDSAIIGGKGCTAAIHLPLKNS